MDTYFEVFLSSVFATGEGYAFFLLFFLFMGRMLPIIGLSPFLGSRVLPNPNKVFLGICLFIVFLPQLLLSVSAPLHFDFNFLLYFGKELFVGFFIGFLMNIPFQFIQSAGVIIDHQRGGASLMVNDPTIQNQSSPLGTLFNTVAIYIFYVIDGPFLFFDGIVQSYALIPPDKALNPGFFVASAPFWKQIIELFNEVMKLAIQLSMPALMAMLMTDMFLGIANRLAPQVQITFLGMPLKSLFGLAVITFGWQLLTGEFAHQLYRWVNITSDAVKMFQMGVMK